MIVVGVDTSTKFLAVTARLPDDQPPTQWLIPGVGRNIDEVCVFFNDAAFVIASDLADSNAIVFVEEPVFVQSRRVVVNLSKVQGAIVAGFGQMLGAEKVRSVEVSTWKKAAVGKGNATKSEVAAYLAEHWRLAYDGAKLPSGKYSQDLIDSACIAQYGVTQMRNYSRVLRTIKKKG